MTKVIASQLPCAFTNCNDTQHEIELALPLFWCGVSQQVVISVTVLAYVSERVCMSIAPMANTPGSTEFSSWMSNLNIVSVFPTSISIRS